LSQRGAVVSYSDPYIPTVQLDGLNLQAEPQADGVLAADCTLIVTDHAAFDYPALVKQAKLIVDTRNALKGFHSNKIVRL
jgi:UDP-N-acetyl-D-glucosamine dehydrogenase